MIKLSSNLQNLIKRSAKASPIGDYAMYGGAGALGGAGLGALINYLRDQSVAQGALVGGGLGGAAGLGTRGIMDLLTSGNEMSTREDYGRRVLDTMRAKAQDPVSSFVASNPKIQELIAEYQLGPGGTLAQMVKERADIDAYQKDQELVNSTGDGDIFQRADRADAVAKAIRGRAVDQDAQEREDAEKVVSRKRDRAALRSSGADFGANFKDNLRYAGRQRAKAIKVSASSAGDYAMYGGAGALGGAGLGALVNYLRDQSVAQGALVGGGIGGAAGLGTRGIMDLLERGGQGGQTAYEIANADPKMVKKLKADNVNLDAILAAEQAQIDEQLSAQDAPRAEMQRRLEELIAIRNTYGNGPAANALHKQIVDLNLQLGDSRAKNTA
jgi:hypothetical protein